MQQTRKGSEKLKFDLINMQLIIENFEDESDFGQNL